MNALFSAVYISQHSGLGISQQSIAWSSMEYGNGWDGIMILLNICYGYGVGDLFTSTTKNGRMIPGFALNVSGMWHSMAPIMSSFPRLPFYDADITLSRGITLVGKTALFSAPSVKILVIGKSVVLRALKIQGLDQICDI